jgi:hypothetical protein
MNSSALAPLHDSVRKEGESESVGKRYIDREKKMKGDG